MSAPTINSDMSWDNSAFLTPPRNGLKPLCSFCDDGVDMSAVDSSWMWFIHEAAIHVAHSECMQQNTIGPAADGLEQLLKGLGGPML